MTIFSLTNYKKYFDISTKQFLSKCGKSLNPLSFKTANADLYGPLWIIAFVIATLVFSSSLSDEINNSLTGSSNSTNYFELLISSIFLFYGYVIIVPSGIYILLKWYWHSDLLNLVELIDMYGYSNLSWLPVAVLILAKGLIMSQSVKEIVLWVGIALGGLVSGLSLAMKLYWISREAEKNLVPLVALVCALHVVFTFSVKMILFV